MVRNKMKNKNIYTIEKEKTIPILDEFQIPKPKGNIIFDEEITIYQDDIYVDNRIRITIEKYKYGVNIYSADFQKQCGLAYWLLTLSNQEFEQFDSIENLINEIFILGSYSDRGTSVATGIIKEEPIKDKYCYEMY